jgi:hypothetical protein
MLGERVGGLVAVVAAGLTFMGMADKPRRRHAIHWSCAPHPRPLQSNGTAHRMRLEFSAATTSRTAPAPTLNQRHHARPQRDEPTVRGTFIREGKRGRKEMMGWGADLGEVRAAEGGVEARHLDQQHLPPASAVSQAQPTRIPSARAGVSARRLEARAGGWGWGGGWVRTWALMAMMRKSK